jgi:hypothetical protein
MEKEDKGVFGMVKNAFVVLNSAYMIFMSLKAANRWHDFRRI